MFFKKNDQSKKEKIVKDKALQHQREEYYKHMVESEKEKRKEEKRAPVGSYISLQHLNKIYSNYIQAVFDFNLEIAEKEFIVFVGPSGCGKSTTLRMIAGLEDITSGDLFIDGVYSNDLEPKDRNVAMVFQSYALYPHMTVYDNLAFGLEVRHVPKAEIEERINRAAKILQIEDYLDRKPKALSGGQCQRVALGRAIVRNSKVFLMDEPLSNLDAKLRVQMRSEIVKLHNELGSTTIYVTHDQTEAMTMASRIVVMNKGYVQQIGSPKEIYDHPANTFVATFIGSPAMNILNAHYKKGTVNFENGFKIDLSKDMIKKVKEFYKLEAERLKAYENRDNEANKLLESYENILATEDYPILFGIRPEDVINVGGFTPAKNQTESMAAKVVLAELLGNEYHLHIAFGQKELIAKVYAGSQINNQDSINVAFDADKIHLFDYASTKYII